MSNGSNPTRNTKNETITTTVHDLINNPKHAIWLCPLLLVFDGLLTTFIVEYVSYTEIDWKAYMQQIETFRNGERDYSKIEGQTGPLVYPAGHVMIFNILYGLTDSGKNLRKVQWIYEGFYLLALSLVMCCYRNAKAPPYLFPLLVLSKRLHSIFVLRLFNDCFAVLGLFAAINFMQMRLFVFAATTLSLAISIKMTVLLALPGSGIVLAQALSTRQAVCSAFIMVQIQVLLAIPFLRQNASAYLSRAFELSRQFLYKWTVNWRFVDEQIFLSPAFAQYLLALNIFGLIVFTFTRWTAPSKMSPFALVRTLVWPLPAKVQHATAARTTPDFIMTTILTSMTLGLLCARSLHYQFFAYIAWSSPFLLWKSNFPAWAIFLIFTAQEWAWNVYPSTSLSSIVVVLALSMQVVGVWYGTLGSVKQLNFSKTVKST